MERLVLDRTRQAEIAAGGPEDIIGRAEDRGHDVGYRRYVQKHLPFRPMQLATGQTGSAERIPMRPAIVPAIIVEGQYFIDRRVAAVAKDFCLRAVQDIGDNDKSVPSEAVYGVVCLVGLENPQAFDAGIGFKVRSLCIKLGHVHRLFLAAGALWSGVAARHRMDAAHAFKSREPALCWLLKSSSLFVYFIIQSVINLSSRDAP